MLTKNATVILRKIAADTSVNGFAPGLITSHFSDINTPAKPLLYTYDPQAYGTDDIWRRLFNRKPSPVYKYTTQNVPIVHNMIKNKQVMDDMLTSGQYDNDKFMAAVTGDQAYPQVLRKHFSNIPDADWNKVFEPMNKEDRLSLDNTRVPINQNDPVAATIGSYYHQPSHSINLNDTAATANMNAAVAAGKSKGYKERQTRAHHSTDDLKDLMWFNTFTLLHEGNHAMQHERRPSLFPDFITRNNKKLGLSDKNNQGAVKPTISTHHTTNIKEQRQAAQAANRSIYALSKHLQNNPLTDNAWKQFDRNKLIHVRDNFKDLPKSREEFIQRMQWFADNPEIALLLGEGSRGVSSRKELQMYSDGYKQPTDIYGAWTKTDDPAKQQEAKKLLEQYDDGWLLGNNQTPNKPIYG